MGVAPDIRPGVLPLEHCRNRKIQRQILSSIYLSIYLSVYLSIHLARHPSIDPSVHLSIYPSIHLSIFLSSYFTYLARTERRFRVKGLDGNFESDPPEVIKG